MALECWPEQWADRRTDGEMAWTLGKACVKWLSDDWAMWSPEVGDQTKPADMFVLA